MTTENQELLKKSFFKRAPFHVVPTDRGIVWAGPTKIRNELERLVSEVRHDGLELSHLGLIYGEYGSGKTHALKYLRERLEDKGKSLVAYLAKPKVERKGSFQGIVKEVVKQIGRNPLRNAVEPFVQYIEAEANKALIQAMRDIDPQQIGEISQYSTIKRAEAKHHLQAELCPSFPEIFNLFAGLIEGNGEAWEYFAGKPSKSALQKFELNSPIEDDHDALRALAAIYSVLTTRYPEIPQTPVFEAAYLFIDEMEQFLELKPDEYVSIRTGLRDLFNSCTEHFCLLLSATAENASFFHSILEEAIMVRLTAEAIHISSHDEVDDGVHFITQLLQFARDAEVPPTPYHPFTKGAIEEIVNRTTEPRTARKLINNCNRIWQKCSVTVLSDQAISEAEVQAQPGLL